MIIREILRPKEQKYQCKLQKRQKSPFLIKADIYGGELGRIRTSINSV